MSTNGFHYIGVGLYAAAEASKISRVSRGRIRRWLRGYEFRTASGRHKSPPVVSSSLPPFEGGLTLTFLDLQEIRFVDGFLEAGVKWKTLRVIREKCAARLGQHPFSRGNFVTDGRLIFEDLAPSLGKTDGAFLDVFNDQSVFKRVISPYVATLTFDDRGQAAEWWPLGKTRGVVLNPQRSFGQPIVAREGVPTGILARAFKVERSLPRVARWFEVSERSLRDAVEYEATLEAA